MDDVFVIVLFTAFTGLAQGEALTPVQFLTVPTAIVFGLLGGVAVGLLLTFFFTRVHIRDSGKVVIILSVSFLLVALEQSVQGVIGFSGLLAVMAIGATLQQKKQVVSKRLSTKFTKLWVAAEVLLFVLVGAAVDIRFVFQAGLAAAALILLVVCFRFAGVQLSLLGTGLNSKERLFIGFSYMPKATVQAAIGGIPLAMGLASGDVMLTVAVLSIILTAPLGATLMDVYYKKLLGSDQQDKVSSKVYKKQGANP